MVAQPVLIRLSLTHRGLPLVESSNARIVLGLHLRTVEHVQPPLVTGAQKSMATTHVHRIVT